MAICFEFVLVFNPFFTTAQTVFDIANNVVVSGNNVAIVVKFNANDTVGFNYAEYIAPVLEQRDSWGDITVAAAVASCSDTNVNVNSVLPNAPGPAIGFCDAVAKCNNVGDKSVISTITECSLLGTCTAVNACSKAIASAYNVKIVNALQAATNAKIKDKGLDTTKSNSALSACGGNLACINNVLTSLKADGGFVKGSTSSDPLTMGGLSDLINNSDTAQSSDVSVNPLDNGAVNSVDNQGVVGSKQDGPKVSVLFSGAGKNGSMMTAKAEPGFFSNASDSKNLYFTWYLKRKDCENGTDVSAGDASTKALKAKCDLDDNGRITENDWKIAATQIIVRGAFDSTGANYSPASYSTTVEKDSGYDAVPSVSDWAGMGNAISAPDCYVQESSSGLMYELRDVTSSFGSCPDGYHKACVYNKPNYQCSGLLNPSYNQDTASSDPSYAVSKTTNMVFGNICFNSTLASDINNYNFSCDTTDIKNFKTDVSCTNGDTATCVKDTGNTIYPETSSVQVKGAIFEDKSDICTAIFKENQNTAVPIILAPVPALLTEKKSFFASFNGNSCATAKAKITDQNNGDTSLRPTCTYSKSKNNCKHLFPEKAGTKAGDGKFTIAEKSFWNTDPTRGSTDGNSNDEKKVTGLGVDTFKWMFSAGDQVGVAVEGDSAFSTEHPDASLKRMWAFSKGMCKKLENLKSKNFYLESTGATKRGFFTTDIDLNDCLEENLLDPEVDSGYKLKVDLISNNENPVNDKNGRGDILTITSNPSNSSDFSGLLYDWSVYKSDSGGVAPIDTTTWTKISTELVSGGSFAAADLLGINKKDLNINLNIADIITGSDSVFWLKIKVRIKGNAVDGSQDAEGSIDVRVRKQQNEMLSYEVVASSAGNLTMDTSLEFCGDAQGKMRCFVNKNSIIGVEVPNVAGSTISSFSWTVNNTPMDCLASVSTQCVPSGNKLFFPVLGSEGEAVDVVATGLNSAGEKIEVSRHFIIAGSQLQILLNDPSGKSFSQLCSADCGNSNDTCPRYLGKYKDIVGGEYPDCSKSVFETKAGKTVSFSANSQSGFNWTIDGVVAPEYSDQQTITFPIEKLTGDGYAIELSSYLSPANKAQLTNIRLALFKNWAISQEEVPEENQTTSIQLDVFADPNAPIAMSGSFGASLITHLPEQLMFLLKISLTSILILFVSGLLFAFMPESIFRKED